MGDSADVVQKVSQGNDSCRRTSGGGGVLDPFWVLLEVEWEAGNESNQSRIKSFLCTY